MKLVLALEMPPVRQEKKECPPSIDERIEYAVDCISCQHNMKEAILFLQKLMNNLEKAQNKKKGDLKRLEYIRAALADYGYLMPDDV
jgi:hypothetical protein